MAKNNQGNSMSEQQYMQGYVDNVQRSQQNDEIQRQIQSNRPSANVPAWMQKPMSPQAREYFAQPANKCQMCGAEGTLGQTGNPEQDEWERKWAVHHTCAHAVWDQLDRASGIASQRRQ